MKKAQGLLEAIIAIGVIVTGLISIISLTISNLTSQRFAAKRYQAINLARESIELARNIRDSNWLAGQPTWTNIDSLANPPLANEQFLRGLTITRRNCAEIPEISDICDEISFTDPVALEVKAIVAWQDSGQQHNVELSEILYDWR